MFAVKSHFYFQIKLSPGLKKLFTVTAVSAISVIFLAHHFKRRRGKKNKKVPPWEPTHLILECTKAAASEKGKSWNPQVDFFEEEKKLCEGMTVHNCNSKPNYFPLIMEYFGLKVIFKIHPVHNPCLSRDVFS